MQLFIDMVFSSLTFLLFFLPIVALLYFIVRGLRFRNAILLVASLAFYAFGEPKWILVMLLMVFVNYLCALFMERFEAPTVRRILLLIGVVLSLGFLFYFKYQSFVVNEVLRFLHSPKRIRSIALPVGISFYTFQILTYIVDVYLGKIEPQRNFFLLLLYVSFFPQLIAGPIVNYKDVSAALTERTMGDTDYYDGFLRFIKGLAKKTLLANTCGEVVAALDGVSTSVGGAWLLAIGYSLQLYFDFSGYSDMAIGLGRMFGFTFRENFLHPYTADSITDFWRKWHVSLGAFFREYVYIPLGGNRVGRLKWCRNLLIVWGLTGIWHGASWNFCLWGLYYGLLLMLEKLFLLDLKKKLPKLVNIPVTLVLVVIGWMLFYFTDLHAGLIHIGRMFGIGASGLTDAHAMYQLKDKLGFLLAAVFACLPLSEYLTRLRKNPTIDGICTVLIPIGASLLLIASILLLVGQSFNPFLYFRF